MSKQVQKIADWDLEEYFPNSDVFQEFLELFDREHNTDEIVAQAVEFADDHNIPLEFLNVDLEAEPDQFVWEVIVHEEMHAAILAVKNRGE